MKYPLTVKSQETARRLVEHWKANNISQFTYMARQALGTPLIEWFTTPMDPNVEIHDMRMSELKELELYKLILINKDKTTTVILLQELANAVEGDFELTPYHVAHRNLVSQQLADILGAKLLEANEPLRISLEELKNSTDKDRQSRLGKVVSELGNILQHTANAGNVIQAITFLAIVLRHVT